MQKSLALILLSALVLAGCGRDFVPADLGDAEQLVLTDSTKEPPNDVFEGQLTPQPPTEITEDVLPLMVLNQSDLGDAYAEFEGESYWVSNDETVENDFEPEDEAEDLERYGRVSGYEAGYADPDALEAGVFAVGFSVGLFSDKEGAVGYLDDSIQELSVLVGQTDNEGIAVVRATKFSAGAVGEQAQGAAIEARSDGEEITVCMTEIMFRRGQVIAMVGLISLEAADYRDEAAALALKLDQRIQDVLAGRITAASTAKLKKTPTPKSPNIPCYGNSLDECLPAQAELTSIASETCEGEGRRVCLVPLGQVDPGHVRSLMAFYKDEYDLTVTLLTPADVPEDMVDPARGQIDAGELIDYMLQMFPEDRQDRQAVLIGLTPVDIYDAGTPEWKFVFGLKYNIASPHAVISTFRMNPVIYQEAPDSDLHLTRTRKMLTKYIGLLYYQLPASSDPRSPLYNSIGGLTSLDKIEETRLPIGNE